MNNLKLLLNQSRSVESDASNSTLQLDLGGDKDIIVDDSFNEVINEYNVYLDEREQCSSVRLTAKVNLIASNVIFNSVTEIVKYEGAPYCMCLNYEPMTLATTIGKSRDYMWGERIDEAVMDTQITYDGADGKNFTFLCGIDIFNNHIMRSKSSTCTFWSGYEDSSFNTISEYLTDVWTLYTKNRILYDVFPQEFANNEQIHRYSINTIQTFFESLNKNLIQENGWYGFINKSQMRPLSMWGLYDGTERVLNNIRANRFVDLFPGRDRYNLLPHYNEYRKRYEKNWEYCLTYPSDSTTNGIDFINSKLNTLKIAFIDENEPSDDGVYRCVIYSIIKHGLNADDTINLYRSNNGNDEGDYELVEGNLVVDEVIDDYTFTVYPSDWVCRKWVSIFDKESIYQPKYLTDELFLVNIDGTEKSERNVNGYLNIDYDRVNDGYIGSHNLSFAKVVNGIQCRYYVRIFSRFPNFDFYDKEITEENIYTEEDGKKPVDVYSGIEYEKQSTITKLGFSRNIYGDDISEIVYNDDIDISVLHDNLGRPLTSLYLTFFKTNYGYREWYMGSGVYHNGVPDYKSENAEWSRCFGKLNCGFEYSPYVDSSKYQNGNVFTMNNITPVYGLNQTVLGGGKKPFPGDDSVDDDEIFYKEQNKFYGDVCMYSPYECTETVIQDCCHRFNTAQRELSGKPDFFMSSVFKSVKSSDIVTDDYSYIEDSGSTVFTVNTTDYDKNPTSHPEGYYYHPNYEIPIRTFSTRIYEFNPKMLNIVKFSLVSGDDYNTILDVTTSVENHFDMNSRVYLYDKEKDKEYECEMLNVLDLNMIRVNVKGLSYSSFVPNDTERYKIFTKTVSIPDYAEMMPENSVSFRWREIVQNGFEETEGIIEEYPFVNGCLYVNKEINIFLRRQDPFGNNGLSSQAIYFGLPQLIGEINPVEDGSAKNANDAIKESDVKC